MWFGEVWAAEEGLSWAQRLNTKVAAIFPTTIKRKRITMVCYKKQRNILFCQTTAPLRQCCCCSRLADIHSAFELCCYRISIKTENRTKVAGTENTKKKQDINFLGCFWFRVFLCLIGKEWSKFDGEGPGICCLGQFYLIKEKLWQVLPEHQSCHSKTKVILGCKIPPVPASVHYKKKYLKPEGRVQFKRDFPYAMNPTRPYVCCSKLQYLQGAHLP